MKISSQTTILELGCIVCDSLEQSGINAFLSGGAVVTIYTENEYQSYDLDFISHADFKKITEVMIALGFSRERGRHFIHPDSKFYVEFPGTAATVGDEPITEFEEIRTKEGVLKLLTPTYCVMDRLSAYFHWKDQQSLEQALLVAKAKPINLKRIFDWSVREGMKEKFKEFERRLKQAQENKENYSDNTKTSVHPWRACPYGEHWVKSHPLHYPPSKSNPSGTHTIRHEHCAHNPSGKDHLYPDEIRQIAIQHFSTLINMPCPLPLNFGDSGSKYDDLIAGWVQYWNEVFKPDTPLDPNLIRALIASESSFDPKKLAEPKNPNSARGLTQLLNSTRKIIGNDKGELKDHFITATRADLNDPGVNICAGVRWLFQKRKLASLHHKRQASWIEAVWEYKGIATLPKKDAKKETDIFNGFYERYQKCAKA